MTGNATVSAAPAVADTTEAVRLLLDVARARHWARRRRYGVRVADRHLTGSDRKTVLRQEFTVSRRSRPASDRLDAARADAAHLLPLLTGSEVVCAYLPLASEPMTTDLLDSLVASGTTVLVPVVQTDAALDWCRYPTPTRPGAFGIAEPSGARLGRLAVQAAGAILVPALAVDVAGHRLGRGGGHYDRTLALLDATSSPLIVAVLFDGEIVDDLPVEHHDRPVGAAVTPSGGITCFPR